MLHQFVRKSLPVWLLLLVIAPAVAGQRTRVVITSSLDGAEQPCYLVLPDDHDKAKPAPLLVSLHSWSADLQQRKPLLEQMAGQRGWVCIFPNFRGANDDPLACGSLAAQQDILDAVAWTKRHYKIDPRRIYLTGVSGGGHMTMLMAGCHPEVWTAASAWVGISDLASWHAKHKNDRYGEMMRKVCGGAPGDSDAVDQQYRLRSPLTHLHRAAKVALDISAGVHDGHTGSVPVRHALDAFNAIAKAAGGIQISAAEIAQISRKNGHLEEPTPSDQAVDPSFDRQIHLRRRAGRARVTIFEGGHEGIEAAAIAWLEKHTGGQ
ncbi:MAG: prolyl oligopeptidase family serine peptidase [Pirellulaceae bacterium]|jgi:dipeptidyl aminopeptidase/acylaminoacyl peptidase|nr:prolyl oligopeptidase family serine peptidase [Pirellulaceae bacterium]